MDSTKQMHNQEDYELDNVYNSETDDLYAEVDSSIWYN